MVWLVLVTDGVMESLPGMIRKHDTESLDLRAKPAQQPVEHDAFFGTIHPGPA